MAKIDLKTTSGLSLVIEDNKLVSTDIKFKKQREFSMDDLKTELLNNELTYPDIFYTKYYDLDNDSVFNEKDINMNLTVIPANLAGIEYTKTKGYVVKNYPRIVEVVNGSGTLLMQSFENSFEGDIVQSSIKKGQKLIIPADYHTSFINTRQTTLVLLEIYSKHAQELYDLDDMNGMAYYVIRKNAKQEIVRNPIYKMVSKGRRVAWDNILSQFNITLKTPVTKQILRKYEKFSWLFKTSIVTV